MGVPGFFAWLLSKYKNRIFTSPVKNAKYLYLDANCLFHPQCFKVLEEHPELTGDELEDLMIEQILKYIDYLIDFVKPSEFTFISVDGVAPLAKIVQQRSRRYKSYKEDLARSEIKSKHNIRINRWSNIVITPGTEFMKKLHKRLCKYYKGKRVIYSSYLTPGEGEHKIFDHIRDNIKDEKIVVYGLDADLIFLSMMIQNNQIFLLRESTHFGNHRPEKAGLVYLSIENTKELYNYEINRAVFNTDPFEDFVPEEDFIKDLVFICYFLGNDFLPHLPTIDIRNHGMDFILDAYVQTYNKYSRKIVRTNMNLNKDVLQYFVKVLASYENQYIQNYIRENKNKADSRQCHELDAYKKDIWNFENMRGVSHNNPLEMFLDYPELYKTQYYNYYFKVSEYSNEFIKMVTEKYLEGLRWILRYYCGKQRDFKWHYPYVCAPFLSDIYGNMSQDMREESNDRGFVNIFTQLLSIIPPQKRDILPKPIKHLIDLPCLADQYPLDFKCDHINKHLLWTCAPFLPILSIDTIERVVDEHTTKNDHKNFKRIGHYDFCN